MSTLRIQETGRPLLSILIPTKNRQDTAIASVIEATKVGTASEVEIVVQDCSDDNTLESQLAEHNLLARVVYSHVKPMSMTDNWNFGMRHLTGEYLSIIGDDDAALPGILEVARWAMVNQCPAVKAQRASFYGWPDFHDRQKAGRLVLKPFTGRFEFMETAPLLRRFSRTGDEYPTLPGVYHNVVRRSVLERIYSKSHRYFDGLSPDIYSAYAIAVVVKSFAVVDYPITIIGASAKSNTNRTPTGIGYLHYTEFQDYTFSSLTPSSWNLYASNADNVVKAFINLSRIDLLSYLDLTHVYARTIVAEPGRTVEHLRKFCNAARSQNQCLPLALVVLLEKIVAKIASAVIQQVHTRTISAQDTISCGAMSLSEATEIQQRWLTTKGVALSCPASGSFSDLSCP